LFKEVFSPFTTCGRSLRVRTPSIWKLRESFGFRGHVQIVIEGLTLAYKAIVSSEQLWVLNHTLFRLRRRSLRQDRADLSPSTHRRLPIPVLRSTRFLAFNFEMVTALRSKSAPLNYLAERIANGPEGCFPDILCSCLPPFLEKRVGSPRFKTRSPTSPLPSRALNSSAPSLLDCSRVPVNFFPFLQAALLAQFFDSMPVPWLTFAPFAYSSLYAAERLLAGSGQCLCSLFD